MLFGQGDAKNRPKGKGKKGGKPNYPKKENRPKGGKGTGCHLCGSHEHWKRDCPQRNQRRQARKGGQGFGAKGNPGPSSGKNSFASVFGKGKAMYYFTIISCVCLAFSDQWMTMTQESSLL